MRFITAGLIVFLIFSSLTVGQIGKTNRQAPAVGRTERRIALVIGNGAYLSAKPLANPANDAADMAKTLRDLGFEVLSGSNQSKRQMESLIREFGLKLASGGTGLFYYAGHGLQVGGSNYLVPVDAEIPEEDEVQYQTVPLDLVLTKMTMAKNDLNIVILDACRNNPFARSWRRYRDAGSSDGLAKISPPTGTLVLYATEPGKVASDGAGRNGLFTESLLMQIKKPNVEYDQMVRALSADVWQRSNRQQLPWKEGNSLAEFYFVRGAKASGADAEIEPANGETVAEKDRATVEREAWGYVSNSSDPQDFQNFLKEFPSGANAGNAKIKLEQAVWDTIKGSRDKAKIQGYLNEFPFGSNLQLARMKLRELDGPAVSPENSGGKNWVSMSVSSARNLATLSAAVERGEEAVIDIKYNTLDSGERNWFTRSESGSESVYLANGKVRISKAGVDFNFTYGLDDFGVTPDRILEVVNEPHQNARIHIKVAVKNKKGNKEVIKNFYFYSPGAVTVGPGSGPAGHSVSCNACDDSMSVLFELLQKARSSWTKPAAPPSASQPAETKIGAGAALAANLTVDLGNAVKMEFVPIRAGSFQMGGDKYYEGQPVHGVTISQPFYLGKYEVTQLQWLAVMGMNQSGHKDCDQCPVENVPWREAQEFINRLNAKGDGHSYRLPTEAEWEYAARAGTTGAYAGKLDAMAWYGNNSGNKKIDADNIEAKNYWKELTENGNQTHPVGIKQPNVWGLYDMHGNVWEWCQDWYVKYSGVPAIDPTGPVNGEWRVARGGSWSSFASNERSAYRGFHSPDYGYADIGFRVVADARTQ
ncbi:MAG TPA: SUMF1/EgtB/PvdO family nonheme iron enzyme [Pyrinomonadaceae bacterium]|nr:SUMF1/EgtB/PvdO family nonheme iron enzyme [Pyrinomonadaceae bacterium]